MAATPYSEFNGAPRARAVTYEEAAAYEESSSSYESTAGGVGGQIFLWLAWAAAAIFWGVMLTTAAGILGAADSPAVARPGGGADAGGISWFLINVVGGTVVLGLAIAWGAYRYATRNKANDPMTEAATRAEYDMVEAAGGDDDIHRSPQARRPEERDAYRAVRP
jgi:hypothetical protein